MKNQILTALTAILILITCNLKINDDNSGFVNILYKIKSGHAGTNETIIIGFDGSSELKYSNYTIKFQLPDSVHKNLNNKFKEADIFNLDDKYPLYLSGNDHLSFTIMYSNGFKSKSIEVVHVSQMQDELEKLVTALYKVRNLIWANPDAITLHISWVYLIKNWPFSGILRLENYHFDFADLDNESRFNDIICYFDSIKYNNQNYLFLENDDIYRVNLFKDEEDGSNKLNIIRFEYYTELPEIFGFRLNEFSGNGYAVSQNVKKIKKFLKDHYLCVFIEDNLMDGIKAGNIYYNPGK